MKKRSPAGDKPFPWVCPECGHLAVVRVHISYTTKARHDNRELNLVIPDFLCPQCANCHELILDNEATEQVSDAIRRQLGLLSPSEIAAAIQQSGKSKRALASEMHVAPETISRWLSGSIIQSCNSDARLRERLGLNPSAITQGDCDESRIVGRPVVGRGEWPAIVQRTKGVQRIVSESRSTWAGAICAENI